MARRERGAGVWGARAGEGKEVGSVRSTVYSLFFTISTMRALASSDSSDHAVEGEGAVRQQLVRLELHALALAHRVAHGLLRRTIR